MTRLAATDIGRRLLSSVALIAWAAAGSSAVTLEVHNSVGGVYVEASLVAELQIRGQSTGRKLTREDIRIVRAPGRIVVRCEPPDSEPIDLHIQLPYDFFLEATTTSGAIAPDAAELLFPQAFSRADVERLLHSGRLRDAFTSLALFHYLSRS